MPTFLFLNQTLWCYHSLESSRRDDFNEGHIIGFGWEMRKLSWKLFCSLALNCSPGLLLKMLKQLNAVFPNTGDPDQTAPARAFVCQCRPIDDNYMLSTWQKHKQIIYWGNILLSCVSQTFVIYLIFKRNTSGQKGWTAIILTPDFIDLKLCEISCCFSNDLCSTAVLVHTQILKFLLVSINQNNIFEVTFDLSVHF